MLDIGFGAVEEIKKNQGTWSNWSYHIHQSRKQWINVSCSVLLREWFHPLWAGFPISINLIKATPTPDMPIGQPNLENPSLSLFPEVILGYIMLAIKANHWPGGGCAL